MQDYSAPLITGEILFGAEMETLSGATVHVYLENVSRLDASSEIITKRVIDDVFHERGTEKRLSFNLYGDLHDERASYSIRVHVDRRGNEQINVGDYVTMESYPVLTFGYPNHVTIRVRKVM